MKNEESRDFHAKRNDHQSALFVSIDDNDDDECACCQFLFCMPGNIVVRKHGFRLTNKT